MTPDCLVKAIHMLYNLPVSDTVCLSIMAVLVIMATTQGIRITKNWPQ